MSKVTHEVVTEFDTALVGTETLLQAEKTEKQSMRFMLLIRHDSCFTERTMKGDTAAWLEEMERTGARP